MSDGAYAEAMGAVTGRVSNLACTEFGEEHALAVAGAYQQVKDILHEELRQAITRGRSMDEERANRLTAQLRSAQVALVDAQLGLDDWMRDEPVDTGDAAWARWNARANVLRTHRDYLAACADEARLLAAPTNTPGTSSSGG